MAARRSNRASKTSELAKLLATRDERFWIQKGKENALKNFHRAVKTIPAYRAFLKKHRVNPSSIRTIEDFTLLPETNKKNYIRAYSLADRSPGGTVDSHILIAASSGTTGAPTVWPRGREQEDEAADVHELLFSTLYEIDRYKTLAIIGFPMGVYISGMATAIPSFLTALKHNNLTLMTAGNNKETILTMLPGVQSEFEQIILIGHPFFVKDVIETGKRRGIRWEKTKLRTFFVSEGFNETWRAHVGGLISKKSTEKDLFSFYGSSELLLMGYETPQTINIRKALVKNVRASKEIFQSAVIPNLFQYLPTLRHIEVNALGELLFTSWSGIPLIRYNMHDSGALIPYSTMTNALKKERVSAGLAGWKPWKLPYVALYGRSDHTLVFYAVNIYPEHIHQALNHPQLLKKLTGKFRMEKVYRRGHEQRLLVHIELQQSVNGTEKIRHQIETVLSRTLLECNMEYADASARLGKNLRPHVLLHQNGDPEYFKAGLKPRYL